MDKELFQLGFSMCDTEMFYTMPVVLKHAYKLTKIVKEETFCPVDSFYNIPAKDFITSYVLKTATNLIFIVLKEKGHHLYDGADELVRIFEAMCWSSAIYRVLEYAFSLGYLESIYIPDFNLFQMYTKYSQYKDLSEEYARSLAAVLSPDKSYPIDPMVNIVTDECKKRIKMQSGSLECTRKQPASQNDPSAVSEPSTSNNKPSALAHEPSTSTNKETSIKRPTIHVKRLIPKTDSTRENLKWSRTFHDNTEPDWKHQRNDTSGDDDKKHKDT